MSHHIQCTATGIFQMGVESQILGVQHFGAIEVQTKSSMDDNIMAQFIFIVDMLSHKKEDISIVSYPVLLFPVLTRLSMQTLVRLTINVITFSCATRDQISRYMLFMLSTVDFGSDFTVNPVTISPSGSNTAGETYSLICSATLIDPIPLPSNVPSPTFEWFFGPNGNASLPSGVTPKTTILSSGNTYTSTLLFSPLSQSHTGMYTCRLGAGILANSAMVTVNCMKITTIILVT